MVTEIDSAPSFSNPFSFWPMKAFELDLIFQDADLFFLQALKEKVSLEFLKELTTLKNPVHFLNRISFEKKEALKEVLQLFQVSPLSLVIQMEDIFKL